LAILGFLLLVQPGQTNALRDAVDMAKGSLRERFDEALREAGYRRQIVMLRRGEEQDAIIVVSEADNPRQALQRFYELESPLSLWMKNMALQVTGVDPLKREPLEVLLDWKA
jgi:hypothetical protein